MKTTNNNSNKQLDRGRAHPTIVKAGFTRRRRRLESGGKLTT